MNKFIVFIIILLILPLAFAVNVYENQSNEFDLSDNSKLVIEFCGVNETDDNEMIDINIDYSDGVWNDPPSYTKNNVDIHIVPFSSEIFDLDVEWVDGICNVWIETDVSDLIPQNMLKQTVTWYTPSNIYPLLTDFSENQRTLYFHGAVNGIYALAGMNMTGQENETILDLVDLLEDEIDDLNSIIDTQNFTIDALATGCNMTNFTFNASNLPPCANLTCAEIPACNCPTCPECNGDAITLDKCRNTYGSECELTTLDKCKSKYGDSCVEKNVCPECQPCETLNNNVMSVCEEKSYSWYIIGMVGCGICVLIIIFKNLVNYKRRGGKKKVKQPKMKNMTFDTQEDENPFNYFENYGGN